MTMMAEGWDRMADFEALMEEHGWPHTPPSELPDAVVRRLTGLDDLVAARSRLERVRQEQLRARPGDPGGHDQTDT